MPSREAVRLWLRDDEVFRAQYARAREAQADHFFDEMVEIADDSRNDFIEKETAKGAVVSLNAEAVSRARLRVETRKWLVARLAPKKYGERAEVELKPADSLLELLEAVRGGR